VKLQVVLKFQKALFDDLVLEFYRELFVELFYIFEDVRGGTDNVVLFFAETIGLQTIFFV
jgi:hypothetical protein